MLRLLYKKFEIFALAIIRFLFVLDTPSGNFWCTYLVTLSFQPLAK